MNLTINIRLKEQYLIRILFFTHCSVILLLGLLLSQGSWNLRSQIYYTCSFKCAVQLWILSFFPVYIFLVVFIASTLLITSSFLYAEKAVWRQRWVHNSSYIILNTLLWWIFFFFNAIIPICHIFLKCFSHREHFSCWNYLWSVC